MTRNEAVALARKHIDSFHPGKHPDFQPMEWVIACAMEASGSEYVPQTPEYVTEQEELPF